MTSRRAEDSSEEGRYDEQQGSFKGRYSQQGGQEAVELRIQWAKGVSNPDEEVRGHQPSAVTVNQKKVDKLFCSFFLQVRWVKGCPKVESRALCTALITGSTPPLSPTPNWKGRRKSGRKEWRRIALVQSL